MPGPNFSAMYPLSAALELLPVRTGESEHPGADQDEVRQKLGPHKFSALMRTVKSVFSCGHRKHPAGHTIEGVVDQRGNLVDLGGYEAHAIYFDDIEAFLKAGG